MAMIRISSAAKQEQAPALRERLREARRSMAGHRQELTTRKTQIDRELGELRDSAENGIVSLATTDY